MIIRSLLRQPVLTIAFHNSDARWTLGGRGRLSSSGRVALGDRACVDGVIEHPEQVGARLRAAPDFPGRGRMQVVLALPAQRTVFRVLELPIVNARRFDELASREIRRELPMLAENAYVSWKRMDDRDGKAIVFVVGVARDVLDSHVAACRAADLQPQAADLRVIASARAIGLADCVIANVEDDDVEIAIFRHGMPIIVRHVDLVHSGVQDDWSRHLGDELARTLKFYRDTHRDDEFADQLPISFLGDAAERALLAPEIREITGRRTEVPALRLVLREGSPDGGFAANVGLALKDIAA